MRTTNENPPCRLCAVCICLNCALGRADPPFLCHSHSVQVPIEVFAPTHGDGFLSPD